LGLKGEGEILLEEGVRLRKDKRFMGCKGEGVSGRISLQGRKKGGGQYTSGIKHYGQNTGKKA